MNTKDKTPNEALSEPLQQCNVIGSRFKPILFSTPMVQAILEGRKTQTRRIIDLPKGINVSDFYSGDKGFLTTKGFFQLILKTDFEKAITLFPKYKIGDILWVRETFGVHEGSVQGSYAYSEGEEVKFPPHFLQNGIRRCIDFKADYPKSSLKWKPSIFMPKEACRIFLKVTDVRVERLQDISEEDAIAEGIGIARWTNNFINYMNHENSFDKNSTYLGLKGAICSFWSLWEKINGEKSWEENPFVWVYTFERIERPHDFR